ncbi:transposase [Streptomyces sp. NBC_01304]|uniref:transposase n=1 Tax=Streptomyces sp. NBC_01304 TaxID=2903818 RepID=UPI003FA3BF9D
MSGGEGPQAVSTDTLGLLLAVHVVAANIQDRDVAKRSLLWTRLDHPGVQKIWADQGFAGRLVEWTSTVLGRELEIVRKAPGQRGFQVQSKRWAVERTLSWITSHRRLARDYETSPAPVRDHDPLGDDRHHGPSNHSRPTSLTPRTPSPLVRAWPATASVEVSGWIRTWATVATRIQVSPRAPGATRISKTWGGMTPPSTACPSS